MKGSQKITIIPLHVDDQDKPLVFGLVTSDPDYKLSLKLNRKLGISLKNDNPVSAGNMERADTGFSRFSDSSGAPDILFYLLSNRSGKNFLLNKLKNIDYLFVIHDPNSEKSPANLISRLREVDSVNAVFEIDINTLKDKNLKFLPR